jgi:hypothetical protein
VLRVKTDFVIWILKANRPDRWQIGAPSSALKDVAGMLRSLVAPPRADRYLRGTVGCCSLSLGPSCGAFGSHSILARYRETTHRAGFCLSSRD